MAVNSSLYPQAQGASRMPQVGFGQSNLSPQYGGMPNQNAFTNANSAANLYSRFGGPSTGGGLPLPSSPSGFAVNMDDYLAGTQTMTPQPYAGGYNTQQNMPFGGAAPQNRALGYDDYMRQQSRLSPYAMMLAQRFGVSGGPNMQAFQNASPNANLGSRFGGGMYTTQPVNNLAFPR